MGQQNKLDQFFRENLDQLEIAPSDQAWKQIQHQVAPGRKILYLKIAASIAILLASIILLLPSNEKANIIYISDIRYPVEASVAELYIPAVKSKEMIVKQTPTKRSTRTSKNPKIVKDEILIDSENQSVTALEIASLREVELQPVIEQPSIQLKESVQKTEATTKHTVKITYIASKSELETEAETKSDTLKNNLFNKVWSIAQNTSPVEIITGLREAKDDFLENGFKKN